MELIIWLKRIREEPNLHPSGEVYQVWCAISRHSITHFHPGGTISHSSGQILPPFRSFAISSTPTWCPPHIPKTERKPEKKSRKQSQEGMLREHKTAKNHLPRTTLSGWLLVCEH
jgi:hypothetical protein